MSDSTYDDEIIETLEENTVHINKLENEIYELKMILKKVDSKQTILYKDYQEILQENKNLVTQINTRDLQLREYHNQLENVKIHNSDLASEVSNLANSVKSIQQNNSKDSQYGISKKIENEKTQKELHDRIDQLRQEKNKYSMRLDAANKEIKQLEFEKSNDEVKIGEYKKMYDDMCNLNKKLEVDQTIFKTEVKNLKSKLNEKVRINNQKDQEIQKLNDEIKNSFKDKKTYESKINKIEKAANEYDASKDIIILQLNEKLKDYKSIIKESEDEKVKVKKEISILKEQIKVLKKQNIQLENIVKIDIEQKDITISQLKDQIQMDDSRYALLKERHSYFENLESEFKSKFIDQNDKVLKIKNNLDMMNYTDIMLELSEYSKESLEKDVDIKKILTHLMNHCNLYLDYTIQKLAHFQDSRNEEQKYKFLKDLIHDLENTIFTITRNQEVSDVNQYIKKVENLLKYICERVENEESKISSSRDYNLEKLTTIMVNMGIVKERSNPTFNEVLVSLETYISNLHDTNFKNMQLATRKEAKIKEQDKNIIMLKNLVERAGDQLQLDLVQSDRNTPYVSLSEPRQDYHQIDSKQNRTFKIRSFERDVI